MNVTKKMEDAKVITGQSLKKFICELVLKMERK